MSRSLGVLVLLAACAVKPASTPDGDPDTTSGTNSSTTAVHTGSAVTDLASSTSTAAITTDTPTTTTSDPLPSCPPAPCQSELDCPDGWRCVDPSEDVDVPYSPQQYCFPPVDPNATGCDIYAQDCPSGFKCVHQIYDGTTPGCVPVQEDASPPGAACEKLLACIVDGDGHAINADTCDVGSQCFAGTCRQFCTLIDGIPACPEGYACNSGRISLWCLQTCDPLAPACPRGEVCTPDYLSFFCGESAPDPAGLFETCAGWGCAEGLACTFKSAAIECDGADSQCCVPFCDLGAPDCPGAGQVCLPWPWQFDPDPEYSHVGICSVPP
ncbi:hypothetical protein [Nannocystis sp.]|uniref:hypothetical protein n=1 Tax=Nannocystis sp. TaxID=1962667 RepID=UPI0025CBDD84|nr:hypothetical protein [Nannocystis sp.]MBK7827408.1 hypothetical protein [Nannocystis sp.]